MLCSWIVKPYHLVLYLV